MDYSLPGSPVHGILQARILEWVAIPFSRGSSWPRDWTQVSCTAGRFCVCFCSNGKTDTYDFLFLKIKVLSPYKLVFFFVDFLIAHFFTFPLCSFSINIPESIFLYLVKDFCSYNVFQRHFPIVSQRRELLISMHFIYSWGFPSGSSDKNLPAVRKTQETWVWNQSRCREVTECRLYLSSWLLWGENSLTEPGRSGHITETTQDLWLRKRV